MEQRRERAEKRRKRERFDTDTMIFTHAGALSDTDGELYVCVCVLLLKRRAAPQSPVAQGECAALIARMHDKHGDQAATPLGASVAPHFCGAGEHVGFFANTWPFFRSQDKEFAGTANEQGGA